MESHFDNDLEDNDVNVQKNKHKSNLLYLCPDSNHFAFQILILLDFNRLKPVDWQLETQN